MLLPSRRRHNYHPSPTTKEKTIKPGSPLKIRLLALPPTTVLLLLLAYAATAIAEPFAAPGDTLLRADLQLLNDAGITNIPLNAWPLSFGDIARGLRETEATDTSPAVAAAMYRLRERVGWESAENNWRFGFGLSAASNPQMIRSFENTPREDAGAFVRLNWLGERLAINLQGNVVEDPFDGDELRLDGTYVGVSLGNWMLSAGWQERWWGPGNAGSLILSSNARPSPGVSIQRDNSLAFTSKWIRWIGPWTFTSFMNLLDDDREIDDTLLFGMRFSFRPVNGLEIGLSRTAQWFSTFGRLLIGKDNRGVNVSAENEPGNQLAGIDIRWTSPRQIPVALNLQWIGEDGRQGTCLQRFAFADHTTVPSAVTA